MYIHEMGVLGVAREEARRVGSPRPIGMVRDLWVELGTSERHIRV